MAHVHFDEEKIAAQIAQMRATLAPLLDAAGGPGVEARFKEALMPAFHTLLAKEINRGSPFDEIATAVTSVVSHLILTLAYSAAGGPNGPIEARAAICNFMMMELAEVMAWALTSPDECIRGSVAPEQAGRG